MVFFQQWLAMRRQRHPMLTVEGKWIWDSWYCRDDQGLWHAFFLQADRSLGNPELRHWNVTWGLAQVLTCANGRIGERFSGRAKLRLLMI